MYNSTINSLTMISLLTDVRMTDYNQLSLSKTETVQFLASELQSHTIMSLPSHTKASLQGIYFPRV